MGSLASSCMCDMLKHDLVVRDIYSLMKGLPLDSVGDT